MSQLNDSDIILFEYNFHYQNIKKGDEENYEQFLGL